MPDSTTLFITLAIIQGLDIATTAVFLSLGMTEANALMAKAQAALGWAWVFAKAVPVLLVGCLVRDVPVALAVMCVASAGVVAWNVYQIVKQRG